MVTEEGIKIIDLDSQNGTMVGGERIDSHEPVAIEKFTLGMSSREYSVIVDVKGVERRIRDMQRGLENDMR